MYELWSGIPMGLGTPIKNIGASLSVKSAEVGEPKKCAQMGKPSGCHEFICLLFLFVAYCILVFACNEVFVFAADQRERFVCWRLIPAPFSFPHHHIVIRPATTAHICWILTMYYNTSIDIVMFLLNVDPKTSSHSHQHQFNGIARTKKTFWHGMHLITKQSLGCFWIFLSLDF